MCIGWASGSLTDSQLAGSEMWAAPPPMTSTVCSSELEAQRERKRGLSLIPAPPPTPEGPAFVWLFLPQHYSAASVSQAQKQRCPGAGPQRWRCCQGPGALRVGWSLKPRVAKEKKRQVDRKWTQRTNAVCNGKGKGGKTCGARAVEGAKKGLP